MVASKKVERNYWFNVPNFLIMMGGGGGGIEVGNRVEVLFKYNQHFTYFRINTFALLRLAFGVH